MSLGYNKKWCEPMALARNNLWDFQNVSHFHNSCRLYMAETQMVRHKTLKNQSINQSVNQSARYLIFHVSYKSVK